MIIKKDKTHADASRFSFMQTRTVLLTTTAIIALGGVCSPAHAQSVIDGGAVVDVPGTHASPWNVGGPLTVGDASTGTLNIGVGEIGRIRVGVHALTPGGFLDDLLARHRNAHPHIALEITEGTARDIIFQLRADQLDIAFVAGAPDLPDCHSRRIWHEPLLAALPASHPLADNTGVTWDDLAGEAFLVRHGGTGPQAYDHIVLRLAGRWVDAPSIVRCDVERCTLLQMIAQGFGVSIAGQATALVNIPGVVFRPFRDEPEPIPFSAVWSPYNQSATLRNLLDLAREMGRSALRE